MLVVKNIPANAGNTRDMGSIPGSGRYSEIGNGNSFQYSCLKNIVDRGVWQDIVHGPTKSQIQLSMHGTHNILKHLKYVNKAWEIFLKWLYEYILWIIKKSVITLKKKSIILKQNRASSHFFMGRDVQRSLHCWNLLRIEMVIQVLSLGLFLESLLPGIFKVCCILWAGGLDNIPRSFSVSEHWYPGKYLSFPMKHKCQFKIHYLISLSSFFFLFTAPIR